MLHVGTGIKLETTYKVRVWSEKRGVKEEAEFKNIVLNVGYENLLDRAFTTGGGWRPLFLYLGTGATEPEETDLGLQDISPTLGAKYVASMIYGGGYRDDMVYHESKMTFNYGEGEAAGTWTELGQAYWDNIGNQDTRGSDNTYTFPYNRSLFRKGLDKDPGTATDGDVSTITDAAKAWDVDQWAGDYSVYILSGTGAGQKRDITSNTGTVLTVDAAWDTVPDNTSVYEIRGTPYSVTVLSDEYLTIVAEVRVFFNHVLLEDGGSFDYDGETRTWSLFEHNQDPPKYMRFGYIANTCGNPAFCFGRTGFPLFAHPNINSTGSNLGTYSNAMRATVTYDLANRSWSQPFNWAPIASDRTLSSFTFNNALANTQELFRITLDQPIFIPANTRLQGSLSYSIFRGDDL